MSAPPMILTLASLPEATSQQGTLTVRSLGPSTLYIENPGLKPILPDPLPPDRTQTVHGVYRYNPVRDVAAGATAALRVYRQNEPDACGLGVELRSGIALPGRRPVATPGDLRSAKLRTGTVAADAAAGRCPRKHPQRLARRRSRRVEGAES